MTPYEQGFMEKLALSPEYIQRAIRGRQLRTIVANLLGKTRGLNPEAMEKFVNARSRLPIMSILRSPLKYLGGDADRLRYSGLLHGIQDNGARAIGTGHQLRNISGHILNRHLADYSPYDTATQRKSFLRDIFGVPKVKKNLSLNRGAATITPFHGDRESNLRYYRLGDTGNIAGLGAHNNELGDMAVDWTSIGPEKAFDKRTGRFKTDTLVRSLLHRQQTERSAAPVKTFNNLIKHIMENPQEYSNAKGEMLEGSALLKRLKDNFGKLSPLEGGFSGVNMQEPLNMLSETLGPSVGITTFPGHAQVAGLYTGTHSFVPTDFGFVKRQGIKSPTVKKILNFMGLEDSAGQEKAMSEFNRIFGMSPGDIGRQGMHHENKMFNDFILDRLGKLRGGKTDKLRTDLMDRLTALAEKNKDKWNAAEGLSEKAMSQWHGYQHFNLRPNEEGNVNLYDALAEVMRGNPVGLGEHVLTSMKRNSGYDRAVDFIKNLGGRPDTANIAAATAH